MWPAGRNLPTPSIEPRYVGLVFVCVGGGCRKELWIRSGVYDCDGILEVCLYYLNVEVEGLFVVAYGMVVGGVDSNVEVDGSFVVAYGVVVCGVDQGGTIPQTTDI